MMKVSEHSEQLSVSWSWVLHSKDLSLGLWAPGTALSAQSSLEPDFRKEERGQTQDPGGSQV